MTLVAVRHVSFDQIDQGIQHALIGLLREARAGISHDTENVKRCIDAAENLLAADGAVLASDRAVGLAQWQVRRVTAMIEADIAAPLTNADLASATRLSTSYFERAFRKNFACPPHKYVLQRRIVRAKVLMITSGEVLSQIALDCGFADQSHFCRVFRSMEGEPPNAWRRRLTEPFDDLTPNVVANNQTQFVEKSRPSPFI